MSSFPSIPNWVQILGGLVTVLSFVPQLHQTCSTKSSSGLSLYYILFHLILATEVTVSGHSYGSREDADG